MNLAVDSISMQVNSAQSIFEFNNQQLKESKTMTKSKNPIAPAIESPEAIRPFPEFHASQAELDDLKRRILATRWPEKEPVNDQTQGTPLSNNEGTCRLLGYGI